MTPKRSLWNKLFGKPPPPAEPPRPERELRDLVEQVQSENARLRKAVPREAAELEALRLQVVAEQTRALEAVRHREAVEAVEQARAAEARHLREEVEADLRHAQSAVTVVRAAVRNPQGWSESFRAEREAASDRMYLPRSPKHRGTLSEATFELLGSNEEFETNLELENNTAMEILLVGASGERFAQRTQALVVRIGRDADNDIVAASEEVSRHHAELRRNGAVLSVMDLGSSNGTAIRSDGTRELVVSMGDCTLHVRPAP